MADLPDLDAAKDFATRKVGPLPVIGWIAAGAGAIFLGRMVKRRFGSAADGGQADAAEDVGSSYDTSLPALDGASQGLADPGESSKIVDNQQWKAKAYAALLIQGVDPLAAEQALQRYLNGQTLTQAEAQMVKIALSAVGLPPTALPAISVVAPAPTTSTPKPTPTPAQTWSARIGKSYITKSAKTHDAALDAAVSWVDAADRGADGRVAPGVWRVAITGPGGFAKAYDIRRRAGKVRTHVITPGAYTKPGNPNQGPITIAKPANTPVITTVGAVTATQPAVRQPSAPATPAAGSPSSAGQEAAPASTVKRGDTLWNMIRSVYGRVNSGMVAQVAAYNNLAFDGANVRPWAVGQTVKWPRI